jgi:FkbM family methyltransferase
MFDSLAKALRRLQKLGIAAIIYLTRFSLVRKAANLIEPYLLGLVLARTRTPGPIGGAIGYLYQSHDPELSAKDIYQIVFSPERIAQGYQSQMGQDWFLNRWFFKNRKPGFFVDVGAFDGVTGSNTYFLEKHLKWDGIAFEPHPSTFEILRANRSCRLIQGCAYDQDGEVPFLLLSKEEQREEAEARSRHSMLSMVFDSTHGGAMLSGIPQHMDQLEWIDGISKPMGLSQRQATVQCHRIDTVLNAAGVRIVDYLSIDVEGAELEVLRGIDFEKVHVNVIGVEHTHTFSQVYDLLTTSGFEYHGMLFFDEIFVNQHLRFSWDV